MDLPLPIKYEEIQREALSAQSPHRGNTDTSHPLSHAHQHSPLERHRVFRARANLALVLMWADELGSVRQSRTE